MITDGFVIQSNQHKMLQIQSFWAEENQEKSPLKSWWDLLANIFFPPDVG